jgi:ABC-type Fe3+/spermidine/putrescine transport system ATPase subunit
VDVLLPPSLLAFSGVGKRFPDGTVALAGVDLSVAPGEFVSILGPSGCGKSTLLRVAAGLSQASDGTAKVGNGPDQTLGNFDMARVGRMLEIVTRSSPPSASRPRTG